MTLRIGNHDPSLTERRLDGSIVKRDRARRIGRHIMLQHRERIVTAREIDPLWVHWFKKRVHGRRCSCWSLQDSPDGGCDVCYGEGIVSPYEKFGYETHVVDTTRENVILVNAVPYPESQLSPVPFAMAPGARKAMVEAKVRLRGSKGLDVLSYVARQSESAAVTTWVREEQEIDFVELTKANVSSRLSATGVTLVFRFIMTRTKSGPGSETPIFSHLMLRHQVSEKILVPMDVPRQNENLQLSELGVIEILSTLRGWMTWEFGRVNPEDFFVSVGTLPESAILTLSRHVVAVETKHRWEMKDKAYSPRDLRDRLGVVNGLLKTDRTSARLKVIGTEPNEALGVHTSTDMDLRHVQKYEAISRIPA